MAKCPGFFLKKFLIGLSFILPFFFAILTFSIYLSPNRSPSSTQVFIDFTPEPIKDSNYPVYRAHNLISSPEHITAKLDLEYQGTAPYGDNLSSLSLEIINVDKDIIQILIRDSSKKQWHTNDFNYTSRYTLNNYILVIEPYPFSFEIQRKSDGKILFSTRGMGFYFSERYLELETFAEKDRVNFGLGERSYFSLDIGKTTLWTRKSSPGHHPFYLEVNGKKPHGVFLHNFNAMEVQSSEKSMKFRTTGGVLDLFVILGNSCEEVIRNYHKIIGFPELPLFRALGYQIGVKEFNETSEIKEFIEAYQEKEVPFDGLLLSKSYLDQNKTFTISKNCENLTSISEQLQVLGKNLIIEVTSGLTSNSLSFSNYEAALLPVLGTSSIGPSGYLDWTHPLAQEFWQNALQNFSNFLPYDGLFLTENEISTKDISDLQSILLPFSPLPSLDNGGLPISTKHYNSYLEVDLHSLWSDGQIKASVLIKTSKRNLIFSSSTRAGTKALHIFTNSYSNWDSLRESISYVLSFSMFGVHSAPSICGYYGLGQGDLCVKWHQLSVFYPLMVSYDVDVKEFTDKELKSIRNAIKLRYSLALYVYSLMFEASLHGGTVVRPMFFEFPEVPIGAYSEQLMLGPALFGIFSFYERAQGLSVYIPEITWYNILDDTEEIGSGVKVFSNNLQDSLIFLRSGMIIPWQNSSDVNSISEIREKDVQIIVALDKKHSAKGVFYTDDGESTGTLQEKTFTKVICNAEVTDKLVIQIKSLVNGFTLQFAQISQVKVYGWKKPIMVKVGSKTLNFSYDLGVLLIFTNITTYGLTEIGIY